MLNVAPGSFVDTQDPVFDPFLNPQNDENKPFLPSLSSPIAQVFDFDVTPLERRNLAKIENVRWLAKNDFWQQAAKIEFCGTSFIHLKCSQGHEKYLRMYCKNDLCPICGTNGSREHKKRVTRAKDRLSWAPVLGYMIFTLPADVSTSRPDDTQLKACSDAIIKILKDNFSTPGGLIRRHDMGDKIGKLHIHFNALFPITNTNGIGSIPESKLTTIRNEWTDFVNSCFDLKCETTNIHYNFATTKKKMYHKIKYVLRPIVDGLSFYTLSDQDKKYILTLKRRHNTRWFGKLSNSTYRKYLLSKNIDPDQYKNSDHYLSKLCPCCGAKFRFEGICHKNDLPLSRIRWLENDVAVDFEIFSKLREPPEQAQPKNLEKSADIQKLGDSETGKKVCPLQETFF